MVCAGFWLRITMLPFSVAPATRLANLSLMGQPSSFPVITLQSPAAEGLTAASSSCLTAASGVEAPAAFCAPAAPGKRTNARAAAANAQALSCLLNMLCILSYFIVADNCYMDE